MADYGNKPGDGPLRQNGKELSDLPQPEQNLPSKRSAASERQQRALGIVRDLADGCLKVNERSTVYLPKAPNERPDDYAVRLQRAVFHEYFGDTAEGLTGMVFRKDPVLGKDVPVPIQEQCENIDNAGTHLAVFARDLFFDALVAGHAAILVEYPATDGTQSLRAELGKNAPVRPYWVPIKKDDIMSWRTTVENGVTYLAQVVLRECGTVADGAFGEKEQTRYRVLYRERKNGVVVVGWTLLEVTERRAVRVVVAGTYPTQSEIPIAEVPTSGRKALFESRPPLLGVAMLNLAHYRQWSDHDTSLHKTCVPIFARIGFVAPVDEQGDPITLGPSDGLDLPQGGDARYVSHDGASLASCKASLDDLKGDIASLGMSMLATQKRAAETATAKRIDKRATDSALAVTARGMQDALERALGFHAKYLKMESGGSVAVNRDFENMTLDPQQISALSQLVVNGQLAVETLWAMLIQGNVLPEDFDADDEKAALEAEAELKRQTALDIARQTAPVPGTESGTQSSTQPIAA